MFSKEIEKYKSIRFTELLAKEICLWRYDGNYSVYNFSDWSEVVKNKWDLAIREKRETEYIGITYENEFIAYGRIYNVDKMMFLGIGLKPEFCGKGHGKCLMSIIVNQAILRTSVDNIYVEVRTFNERAKKCYESIDFEVIDKYWKNTLNGGDNFYLMQLKVLKMKDNDR